MSAYPATRMRRLRRHDWTRRLVAETTLSPADFIWPVFVIEGENKREAVASMPGVERLSVDLVVTAAKEAAALGIPVIALFPQTPGRAEDRRRARSGQRGQSGVPRRARHQGGGAARSACCATWRWIPIPATAMTGCCATAMCTMTPRSTCW